MKPERRIAIKVVRRNKNLKILLTQSRLADRRLSVRMGGQRWPHSGRGWPADARPVSLTKVLTALRKALVKAADLA